MTRRRDAKRPGPTFMAGDLVRLSDGFGGLLPGHFYTALPISLRPGAVNAVPRFRNVDDFARAVVEGSVREGPPSPDFFDLRHAFFATLY